MKWSSWKDGVCVNMCAPGALDISRQNLPCSHPFCELLFWMFPLRDASGKIGAKTVPVHACTRAHLSISSHTQAMHTKLAHTPTEASSRAAGLLEVQDAGTGSVGVIKTVVESLNQVVLEMKALRTDNLKVRAMCPCCLAGHVRTGACA